MLFDIFDRPKPPAFFGPTFSSPQPQGFFGLGGTQAPPFRFPSFFGPTFGGGNFGRQAAPPFTFPTDKPPLIAPQARPTTPAQAGAQAAAMSHSDPVLAQQARLIAEAEGINPDIYANLIQAESDFNPNAISIAGAQGLAQLMPGTARGLGITDPFDPMANLQGGARYLKQMLDMFGGDYQQALAAYNWGPGNVQSFGLSKAPAETQAYIKKILTVNSTPGPTAQPTGQGDWLQTAQGMLGQAYVWGGKDPKTGFDCSGFAGYISRLRGVPSITGPESTVTLYGKSAPVGGEPQPGDLVFYNMNQNDMTVQHVAIYIGNGQVIQAGGSARSINTANINQRIGSPPEIRRLR